MSIPEGHQTDKERPHTGDSYAQEDGFQAWMRRAAKDWAVWAIVLLTGSLCFGLGLLAALENGQKGEGLWIEQLPKEETAAVPMTVPKTTQAEPEPVTVPTHTAPAAASQPAAAAAALASPPQSSSTYVASKSGTKYYLPSCATAKRIKDENRVWFATKADAEKAGYAPSSTCKGL